MACMFYFDRCINITFNSLLAHLVKYDVHIHTTRKIKFIGLHVTFITRYYFTVVCCTSADGTKLSPSLALEYSRLCEPYFIPDTSVQRSNFAYYMKGRGADVFWTILEADDVEKRRDRNIVICEIGLFARSPVLHCIPSDSVVRMRRGGG